MTHAFAAHDSDAQAFYEAHGYVVLTPRFSSDERRALQNALDRLWARYAAEQGLALDTYLASISQWRDLWHHDDTFRCMLGDPRLWSAAAHFMGRPGARLLHDHVIAKPAHASGTIPWHQDYPYWPVDTAEGLSCWCPLEDVGLEGGCLEVIDGSHLWGESPPADFLASEKGSFDSRDDLVRLPVPAGSLVILNSLTWHRSGPNREAGKRRAYISLWLPPDARYAPEHSNWHPVNEHVTAKPGELLNDDWFPCFGTAEVRSDGPRPLAHTGPSPRTGLSMFDASRTISDQLRTILSRGGYEGELPGSLGRLLANARAVELIVRETVASGIVVSSEEGALRDALDQLRIGSEAYRLHRARNVYNGAYVDWWRVAGAAWEARLGTKTTRAESS